MNEQRGRGALEPRNTPGVLAVPGPVTAWVVAALSVIMIVTSYWLAVQPGAADIPETVTTELRHAGSAVLITYKADSAPNSVTGKVIPQDIQRYEFWKDGNQVTLRLSAPVGSDSVDPSRTVTDSFRWVA